jgi:hypothetical protein
MIQKYDGKAPCLMFTELQLQQKKKKLKKKKEVALIN